MGMIIFVLYTLRMPSSRRNVVIINGDLQFEFTDGYGMVHKAWSSKEEVPYCFQGHRQISRSQGPGNRWTVSDISSAWWQLQIKFMDDYEMTHIAFRSMSDIT